MELRNKWVNFMIRDVYIPDPQQVLTELYGNQLLQGRVIDLSDCGARPGAFAVVEVDGVNQRLVVPVDRILGVL